VRKDTAYTGATVYYSAVIPAKAGLNFVLNYCIVTNFKWMKLNMNINRKFVED